MQTRIDLQNILGQIWVQKPELQPLESVVIKELIHYEILWALDRKGFLGQLTFHGGTALRLCFGANRLSEDLDFAGGSDFTRQDVDGISEVLRTHLTRRYGLEVTVKEPKPQKKEGSAVAVDTWQISVVTNPQQKHLPRQRIKIDITTMESRSRDLHSLRPNYAVLPSGFDDLLVPVMSREEIMANKLVSLPVAVNRNRIRFRDIWDIAWLDRQGIQTNHEWIAGRIGEFGIEDFGERVKAMRQMLQQAKTQTRFRKEMARFLPLDVITRTIDRPEYMSHVIRTVDGRLAESTSNIGTPENSNGSSQDPDLYRGVSGPSPF